MLDLLYTLNQLVGVKGKIILPEREKELFIVWKNRI